MHHHSKIERRAALRSALEQDQRQTDDNRHFPTTRNVTNTRDRLLSELSGRKTPAYGIDVNHMVRDLLSNFAGHFVRTDIHALVHLGMINQ